LITAFDYVWARLTGRLTGLTSNCAISWRAAGQVKDRAEPGRVSGAAGVLEVTGREPDDGAAGNGSRGACGVCVCSGPSRVRCVPVRAVPLAAVLPSRARAGAGAHGAGPRQGSGQAGSIKRAPAPPVTAAGPTTRRPRAWPLAGRLFMPPAGPGSPAGGLLGGGARRGTAPRAGPRTPRRGACAL